MQSPLLALHEDSHVDGMQVPGSPGNPQYAQGQPTDAPRDAASAASSQQENHKGSPQMKEQQQQEQPVRLGSGWRSSRLRT
jgi:hypothetical protein